MLIHYGPVFRCADGSRPEPGATLALCRHGEQGAELGILSTAEPVVTCGECRRALDAAGPSGWPRVW